MSNHNDFLNAYVNEVVSSLTNNYKNNYDYFRFGNIPQQNNKTLKSWGKEILGFAGVVRKSEMGSALLKSFKLLEGQLPRFEILYKKVSDRQSQEILIKLLTFRCLGHRTVKLPLNQPSYWDSIKAIQEFSNKSDFIEIDFNHWKLFRLNLNNIGIPIDLYLTVKAALNQFILKQYECVHEHGSIKVEPGDHAIDAGACWGDTALSFAQLGGPESKVYSFEFIPSNLEIMNRNFSLNPELKERIKVFEQPLWEEHNLRVFYKDNGPSSRISFVLFDDSPGSVETTSIDYLFEEGKIPKVDFIKMDIEGAELTCLKGAVQTIQKNKPKLAISVYHHLEDFLDIPEFIDSLNLGYRYYLRHFTIHKEETILFAEVKPR